MAALINRFSLPGKQVDRFARCYKVGNLIDPAVRVVAAVRSWSFGAAGMLVLLADSCFVSVPPEQFAEVFVNGLAVPLPLRKLSRRLTLYDQNSNQPNNSKI
jgi:hypothetical protein